MLLLRLILIVLPITACSSLESWRATNAQRRSFQVHADWIRQTTKKTIPGFRKINRMQPLLYSDKVHGDLVISANAIDGVLAYKRESGKEIWRLDIENGAEANASLINNRLFLGGLDGQFYSIDAGSGEVLWTFPTRVENLSEPTLVDGILYFMNGASSVYAVDAASGKQLWMYSRQETTPLSIRGGSKPAFKDGTLFVGFTDGYMVALNADSGSVKWEKLLSKNKRFKDLDSNPLIDGDRVYVSGFDDSTYSLSSKTGEIQWRSEVGGFGGILSHNDNLYLASSQGEFLSLDRATGKKNWAIPVKDGIATAAIVYKGLIVFGESGGSLRFVDAKTGKELASFNPGRGVFSPPSGDEKLGMVYFISGEANLYGLNAKWDWPKAFPYLR